MMYCFMFCPYETPFKFSIGLLYSRHLLLFYYGIYFFIVIHAMIGWGVLEWMFVLYVCLWLFCCLFVCVCPKDDLSDSSNMRQAMEYCTNDLNW